MNKTRPGLGALLLCLLMLIFAACGSSEEAETSDGGSESDVEARVYPTPGSRVASDRTQISFVGVDPDQIGEIRVIGSRSGEHSGTFKAYEAVRGASFIPEEPFLANEKVSVETDLNVVGAEDGDFSFTIANFRTQAAPPPKDLPPEGTIPPEPMEFRSRPDLRPPVVNVKVAASAEVAPGFIFMAPKLNGPMILDNQGELIYYKPGIPTADFKPQEYGGETYLTWWQGPFNAGGYTEGRFIMADSSYEVVRVVKAGNGYFGDLHEFKLTDRGTAFVPAYRAVLMDLSDRGGPSKAAVLDSIAQEIDIETGLVVWEWHSLDNVPVEKSYIDVPETPEQAFDYFHINSINEDEDGNVIISARNTRAFYKVDRATGEVIWQIGGREPTFKQGKGLNIAWQHDAIPHGDGIYTLYDNGAAPPVAKRSRGLVIEVDEQEGTARLARPAYTHPEGLLASSQGNMQLLPNGNVFIGWGSEPYFTEFSEDGEVLFDANFAARNSSYRAYRFPWTGTPSEDPAIATYATGDGVRAWVSWNGATEVASWELLAGDSEEQLEPVAKLDRQGFETELTAQGRFKLVAARALDAGGEELGRSPAVAPGDSWYPGME